MIGIKQNAIKNSLEKLLKSFENQNNKAIRKNCIKLINHIEHYMGLQRMNIGGAREIKTYKLINRSALLQTETLENYNANDNLSNELGKKIYDNILTIYNDVEKYYVTNPGDADVYTLNQLYQIYRLQLKSHLTMYLQLKNSVYYYKETASK